MGVCGFFSYLLRTQKLKESIIYQNINKDIDILYFDFNGLIHNSCARVRKKNPNWKTVSSLESLMYEEILEYMNYIVEFVNPKYGIFIAIDGSCPQGKVVHQRDRRYKAVIEIEKLDNLKKKHNIEIDKYWATSKISPGTNFMLKLEKKILSYIKKKYKHIHVWLSPSGKEHEAEHKIIHHIKSLKEKKQIAIHGLDADLLFLTLGLKDDNNILLLRETVEFDKNASSNEFTWVDIEILKKEINLKMNHNNTFDFIFLCFLLGNDFIPKLPTLNIYKNAIPFLIFEYNKLKVNHDYLINPKTLEINILFFKEIMYNISVRESYFLQNQYIEYRDRKLEKKFDNAYEKELYIYENLLDHTDDIQLKGKNIKEDKKKYYSKYFESVSSVEIIVHHYLKILQWCLHYYFRNILSWSYCYPYHHGPFASDIYTVLNKLDFLNYRFELSSSLHPIEQLLLIIPKKDKNIILKDFQYVYDLKEFSEYYNYKKNIKYDNNYIKRRYLNKILLPSIDLKKFREMILKKMIDLNINNNIKKITINKIYYQKKKINI